MQRRFVMCAVALSLVVMSTAASAMERPFKIGFGGGVSVPVSDAKSAFDNGFHGKAMLQWKTPAFPLALGASLGYEQFSLNSLAAGVTGTGKILSALGNVSYGFPVGPVKPYLIAGLGAYNMKSSVMGVSGDSQTKFGIDGGAGPARPAGLAREEDRPPLGGWRVERPPLVAVEDRQRLLAQLRREVDHVLGPHALPLERGGPGRDRLGRGRLLAGHQGLGHRALLDGPDRAAGHPVEHIDESLLGDLGDRLDALPVHGDVDEVRRRGEVVVPEGVADNLEVPDAPARRGVQADERLGEEVVPGTMAAVVVVGRRADRQVHVPELLVGAHGRPHVDAADGLPALPLPRLVPDLAVLRDRVEDPALAAGTRVEAAHVTGRHVGADREVVDRGADDHDVADHDGR